jgi:hypothetical protein
VTIIEGRLREIERIRLGAVWDATVKLLQRSAVLLVHRMSEINR